ncbi:MAG TPA: pyridoxal-phosphate dependent enzyme [Candidatus Sulfotelmatobacter sp.]|jgi:threonine dehydratase|nr:pyridoxal-phosphate dependent enzyme [Candidatus Sulfotelmatobacter sp.]
MATHFASVEKNERNIPPGMIDDARKHVYEAAIRTPLVRLNYDGPAEIYLKLECLQPIGAFKIRGAYNAVRLLPEAERRRGVWTVSAGNAAQGVALAARKAGVPCRVLVIDAAPAAKLDAVRRLGGEIVKASYDDCWRALADRAHPAMNGAFVHPFEDDEFIAGNASAGLEILEDLPDVEAIVASFGGGGLSCGIAAAMKERAPKVKVFAAEPETAAPLAWSLAAGSPQKFPTWKASWVDGCGGKSVFPRMWDLAHHLLAGSIVSTLDEVRLAMKLVAERNHVISEGAGACAVAAGLSGKCGARKIVCVVSGGNIDLSVFAQLVNQP